MTQWRRSWSYRLAVGLVSLAAYGLALAAFHDASAMFFLSAVFFVGLGVGSWVLGRWGGAVLGASYMLVSWPLSWALGFDIMSLWGGMYGMSLPAYYTIAGMFSSGMGFLTGSVGDYSRQARIRARELADKNVELEQATARLAASEEMFRQFADRINVGAWIAPADQSRAAYRNPELSRIFGISQDAAWSPTDQDAYMRTIHPMDLPAVQASGALAQQGTPQDIEYRTLTGDQIRWFRSQCFPIRDDAGKVISFVGLFEDITERKDKEAQRDVIERRERLSSLGSLVAGVAHEVNNPLTYVVGNVVLARKQIERVAADAREGKPLDAQLQRMDALLASAHGGGERIARIVRALRAVTQHRRDSERSSVDLNALAANVRELMNVNLPHNVKLELDLGASGPTALARSDEMHQVVLNLATNAVQALGAKGGHVRIETRTADHHAVLRVVDDGPGMTEETRRKLFTPFFTTKPEGTGLGLSIVHSIVRGHDGEIDVDSKLGMGTSVTVKLPIAGPAAPPRPPAAPVPEVRVQ